MPTLTLALRWEQQTTSGTDSTPLYLKFHQYPTAGQALPFQFNWFQCSSSGTIGCALTPSLESIDCTAESKWHLSDCVFEPFTLVAGVKQANYDLNLEPLDLDAHTHDISAGLEPLTCEGTTIYFDSECYFETLDGDAHTHDINAELAPLDASGESYYQTFRLDLEPLNSDAESVGITGQLEPLNSDGTSTTRPPAALNESLEPLISDGTSQTTFDAQLDHSFEALTLESTGLNGANAASYNRFLSIKGNGKSATGHVGEIFDYLLRLRSTGEAGEKVNAFLYYLLSEGSSATGHVAKGENQLLEEITCTGESNTGTTSSLDHSFEQLEIHTRTGSRGDQYRTDFEYLICQAKTVKSSMLNTEFEPIEIEAVSFTGRRGRLNETFEHLALTAHAGSKLELSLQELDSTASTQTGTISFLDEIDFEPLDATAQTSTQTISKLDDEIEPIYCEGNAENGTISALSDGQLSEIILQAKGLTGTISRAIVALPALELSERIISNSTSTAYIELPALQIHVSRIIEQSYSPIALTMNTETNATSVFTQYQYHSLGESKKGYLAATDDGIFILDGETDAGTPIDAMIRSGYFDLAGMDGVENSAVKRCTNAYIGYRSDAELTLTIKIDGEKDPKTYVFDRHENGLTKQRAKLSRGIKSRYWQYELKNVSGADFDLDQLEFLFEILTRKIG